MRLWLIRHAKSSWANPAQGDFERPLNARGQRDGPIMQAWLARQAWLAQWIWTSDAARAQATATFVAAAFPQARLQTEPRLYGADAQTILQVAGETPSEATTAAIVAHNPGLTWCLNLLVGKRVTDNLPTFGAALVQWPGKANAPTPGAAKLLVLSGPGALSRGVRGEPPRRQKPSAGGAGGTPRR